MGYSYFGAHGRVAPAGLPYSSINYGAIGSGAYYFDKYFGGEVIYTNHPDGVNDGMSGISGGLIARLPMENFTMSRARDWSELRDLADPEQPKCRRLLSMILSGGARR